MHESLEIFIVIMFAAILLIGAATRSFSRLSGVPFTLMMLLLGVAGGLYIRFFTVDSGFFNFFHQTEHHSLISPELILFIFLPMLIFESAFSLDAHIFRKSLGNIVLLAGPAIILTTVLTALLMLYITPAEWGWSLSYALLFGALINATDPVAVVALLRELGISKRLVTLIEGESLLNDGTAIVLFTVFLAMSLSGAEHFSVGEMSLEFVKVVVGGCLVGWLLAQIISRWIGRVFNDPLVEITLMMAMAYLAMIIAEHYLHVSGIMAMVVAGLYMSSIGRTRISPEVMHFLHEFWEMMAYIANSVIFFLVGLVIALQVQHLEMTDLYVAFAAYVGIMLIRFIAVFAFRPIFSLIKTPISKENAMIASWGGLRGAVSLALALMLSQTPGLDEGFRQQALLFTVFIVLTTVVFNGATMKSLLRYLNLDKPSLSTQISANLAKVSVLNDVKKMIDELSASPNFKNVYWSDVRTEVEELCTLTRTTCDDLERQIEQASTLEHEAEFWLRVLNIERAAYWELFAQGILTDKAISILNHEVDLQMDDLKENIINPPLRRTPKPGKMYQLVNWLQQKNKFFKKTLAFLAFDNITNNFHFLHAEGFAAQRVLHDLSALEGMNKAYENHIRETYQCYLNNSKERLEEMRADLPELTQAMETYFAKRLTLNHEREGIKEMLEHGIIDEGIAKDSLESVESRMMAMKKLPKHIKLPSARDLIGEISLFRLCKEEELDTIADALTEVIILKGEYLFKENEQGNSLFIVVRGALEIEKTIDGKDTVLAVLGGGDIVGEMALLTGQPRMASALAATTVTLLKIDAKTFHALTEQYPDLLDHTWAAYGRHGLHNTWQNMPALKNYSHEQVEHLLENSEQTTHKAGDNIVVPDNCQLGFLLLGKLSHQGQMVSAPGIVKVKAGETLTAEIDIRVLWLID